MSKDTDILADQTEDNLADDTIIEGMSDEVLAAREGQVRNALAALREAETQIINLHKVIKKIRGMLPEADDDAINGAECINVAFVPFSHVGKEVRNKLLADLYTNLESVEDSIKATWRSVKGVKRSRLTEEQIDQLIIISATI